MEREVGSTFSIRSFLRALRCLAHFEMPCALCVEKYFEMPIIRQFAL